MGASSIQVHTWKGDQRSFWRYPRRPLARSVPLDDELPQEDAPAQNRVTHAADLELARTALAQDEASFRGLASRLACIPRYVHAWNRREHLGLDEAEVEDVCQDVLVLAWRKLDTFHGRASLESWAFGLALGQLKNAVRAKRRRARRFPAQTTSAEPDPTESDAGTFALSEEDSCFIRAAVDELPDDEAQIVRRKHYEDLTFERIAAELGLSPNTVKSRYYRALVRLTTALRRWRLDA